MPNQTIEQILATADIFDLNEKEKATFRAWLETKNLNLYEGPFGGRFYFRYCPTTVARFIEVTDYMEAKDTIDITDDSNI